jgi:hypothetical protein
MGEPISRGAVKTELLRRQYWEQVPVFRCSAHRGAQPALARPAQAAFRNFTAAGVCYWSGELWESEWPQVPELCRQALVVVGLPGPPFHCGSPPSDPRQLDLRGHFNACGERAWWWGARFFDPDRKLLAPDLAELMRLGRGRSHCIGTDEFWLDGVIQLQGKVPPNGSGTTAFSREVFPWTTGPIPVGRNLALITILIGCVWEDQPGREVGALVWRYASGEEERTSLLYGSALRRSWLLGKSDTAAEPLAAFNSSDNPAGPVRVYAVSFENPRPAELVASLAVESSRDSPAAPFVLAVTVRSADGPSP